MVPMCWGGGAGYGTHVLGWRSWLWYPCVGVEELAMAPMCWGGVAGYGNGTHVLAGYGTHVLWWSSWLWHPYVGVE